MTRRRLVGRLREAVTGPMPNEWKTLTGATVEVYRQRSHAGAAPRWRWRVVAVNGEKVAASGQSFTRARGARRAAALQFPPLPGAGAR